MFVSGPVGISVTGSGAASSVARRNASAPSGRTSERRLGEVGAVEPALAVHVVRDLERADQRGRGAGRDRHVRAAEQGEHPQGVARRLAQADVAAHGRDAQHLELRAGERERDRERVVVARVAVEQDRDRRGYGRLPNASTRSVAKRSPSMTMPTSALGVRPSRRSRYGWPSQTVRPRAGPSVDVEGRRGTARRRRGPGSRGGRSPRRRGSPSPSSATTACCGRARSPSARRRSGRTACPCRAAPGACDRSSSAWWVTSRPIIVIGTPDRNTTSAASGSA